MFKLLVIVAFLAFATAEPQPKPGYLSPVGYATPIVKTVYPSYYSTPVSYGGYGGYYSGAYPYLYGGYGGGYGQYGSYGHPYAYASYASPYGYSHY